MKEKPSANNEGDNTDADGKWLPIQESAEAHHPQKAPHQHVRKSIYSWFSYPRRWIGGGSEWLNSQSGLVTALATAVMAFFTYYLAVDSSGQRAAVEGQLNEMKNEQRPWMSVEVVPASNLVFHGDTIFLEIDFIMKNAGKNPAAFVWPETAVIPNGIGIKYNEWQKPANCVAEPRPEGARNTVKGFTIFPDQTLNYRGRISIDRKKINPTMNGDHPSAAPVIVGCVRYKFTSDNTWHQTGFAYLVGKSVPDSVSSSAIIVPLDEGNIDLSLLRFAPWAIDGGRFFDAN